MPTQAGPELPSRATPTATPRPENDRDKQPGDRQPIGAYLELQTKGAPNDAWAVVQWQDSAGGWNDVEGWQGTLDSGGKRWWVSQADFNKGPFRWAVYRHQRGALLATSDPFYLPSSADQLARSEMTLTP
jgi:hypothetical protein